MNKTNKEYNYWEKIFLQAYNYIQKTQENQLKIINTKYIRAIDQLPDKYTKTINYFQGPIIIKTYGKTFTIEIRNQNIYKNL